MTRRGLFAALFQPKPRPETCQHKEMGNAGRTSAYWTNFMGTVLVYCKGCGVVFKEGT